MKTLRRGCRRSLVPHSARQVLSLQVVIGVFEQTNGRTRKITDVLWVTCHVDPWMRVNIFHPFLHRRTVGLRLVQMAVLRRCGDTIFTCRGSKHGGITTCKWIRSALTTSLFHPHRIGRCFGFGLIELWLAGHTDLSTSSITAASRCPRFFLFSFSY